MTTTPKFTRKTSGSADYELVDANGTVIAEIRNYSLGGWASHSDWRVLFLPTGSKTSHRTYADAKKFALLLHERHVANAVQDIPASQP